jgi:hypothetical protein
VIASPCANLELRSLGFALIPTLDRPHFDVVLPDLDDTTLDRLELDANYLGAAVDKLITATGPHANHSRALGQLVQQWAASAGIDLPTPEPPRLTRPIAGPDLGL